MCINFSNLCSIVVTPILTNATREGSFASIISDASISRTACEKILARVHTCVLPNIAIMRGTPCRTSRGTLCRPDLHKTNVILSVRAEFQSKIHIKPQRCQLAPQPHVTQTSNIIVSCKCTANQFRFEYPNFSLLGAHMLPRYILVWSNGFCLYFGYKHYLIIRCRFCFIIFMISFFDKSFEIHKIIMCDRQYIPHIPLCFLL